MDREDEAEGATDLSAALNAIRDAPQRGTYLLLDAHPYLGYAASYQRALRDLIQRRAGLPHVLVLIGTKVELPEALELFAVRFSLRLPDANALPSWSRTRSRLHRGSTAGGGSRPMPRRCGRSCATCGA